MRTTWVITVVFGVLVFSTTATSAWGAKKDKGGKGEAGMVYEDVNNNGHYDSGTDVDVTQTALSGNTVYSQNSLVVEGELNVAGRCFLLSEQHITAKQNSVIRSRGSYGPVTLFSKQGQVTVQDGAWLESKHSINLYAKTKIDIGAASLIISKLDGGHAGATSGFISLSATLVRMVGSKLKSLMDANILGQTEIMNSAFDVARIMRVQGTQQSTQLNSSDFVIGNYLIISGKPVIFRDNLVSAKAKSAPQVMLSAPGSTVDMTSTVISNGVELHL